MIKLIASDMDGTLLDAHMSVSPENAEAIRFANDAGVEFMVATGRNYQEARAALDEVGIDCAIKKEIPCLPYPSQIIKQPLFWIF